MLGVDWGTQSESWYNCLESLLERTYSTFLLKIINVVCQLSDKVYLTFDNWEEKLF